MAHGRKTGGRRAGVPNKRSEELLEILQRLNCNPTEGLALIGNGDYICTVCLGAKKLKYRRRDDGELFFDPEGKLMDCLNCFGSGREQIPIGLQLKAFAELQQYVFPKRKAIDVNDRRDDGKGDFTLVDLVATIRKLDL
jgi:hypothetical protein